MRLDPRISYESWLAWVFDHPATRTWFWQGDEFPEGNTNWPYGWDCDDAPAEASKLLAHMTRLFSAPREPISDYSLAQVSQGYEFLGGACWGCACTLTDLRLPEPDRVACVRAMETLYRELFAGHCAPALSHVRYSENPLNGVCYMWWDMLPWGDYEDLGRPTEDDAELGAFDWRVVPEKLVRFRLLHAAMLDALREILRIDHRACRDGALHGLGHLQEHYPREVSQIVREFLGRERSLSEDLVAYAEAAAEGAFSS